MIGQKKAWEIREELQAECRKAGMRPYARLTRLLRKLKSRKNADPTEIETLTFLRNALAPTPERKPKKTTKSASAPRAPRVLKR